MIKKIYFTMLALLLPGCITNKTPKQKRAVTSFYNLSATNIDGKTVSMSQYKGKYVLVVNVASKCSYTKQYVGLEKLYKQYKDKLVVLGFPCNQFLWQESGSNADIKSFCSIKYNVTFPMFEKIHVKGKKAHALYQWLTNSKKNGWNTKKPSWNFNKYLIGPNGNLIAHFGSSVEPLSAEIINKMK